MFTVHSIYMLMVCMSDLQSTYVYVKDKSDLLSSSVHVESYGHLTGSLNLSDSLSEVQLQRTFSDLARKPW